MLLPQSVVRVTLDVRDVENQLSFSVKQNDSVRRIIVNLTDKGKPYLIGVGCYAVFSATTSKNTVISNGCQIKNNEIIYDLSETDTAVVGRMDAEITLFGKDDEVLSAPNFTINVYKSKIGEYAGEVVASNDYSTLKNLIGETNERIAKVDAILESDGRVIEDAFREAISGIDAHAADVVNNMPDTYVELASSVAKSEKEILTRPTGTPFTDDKMEYVKVVPGNALPAAKIVKVGGMTHKIGDVFKSAVVTAIEVVGANLFDQNEWFNRNGFTPYTDGSYKGKSINAECFKNTSNRSGTIYISYEGRNATDLTPLLFQVYYTDGTNALIGALNKTNSFNKIIALTNSHKTVDRIIWSHANGADYYIKNVMISFVNSEYTPYKREVITIPEAIRPVNGVNKGVCDFIDFKNMESVKATEKIVLTGTEEMVEYTYNGHNGVSIVGVVPTTETRAIGICTDSDKVGEYFDSNAVWVGVNTQNVHWVGILDILGYTADAAGVTKFKNYVAQRYANGNPVTIVYKRSVPVVTDISSYVLLPDFIGVEANGTITFANENGLAVPSEVEYYVKAVSGVMVGGTPALKVGDTIIEEARLKMLLEALKDSILRVSKIGNVTLLASAWEGGESPYWQVVSIEGVTQNSQVDLTPSVEQLAIFHNKDLAFVTENDGGVVTVYAVGEKPTNDYTIQVTITEVYA